MSFLIILVGNQNNHFKQSQRTMLEYTITVLQKVSFDRTLFTKEVKKAIKTLLPQEIEELKIWLHHFINDKPELEASLLLLKV